MREAAGGVERVDRCDVHDAASLLLHHLSGGGLREEERAREVRLDHAPPELGGHLEHRREGEDPGVVHEHVEPTERADGSFDQRVGRARTRDVGGHRLDAVTARTQFLRGGVDSCAVEIREKQRCARFGEAIRGGEADTLGGAGHEGNAVLEAEAIGERGLGHDAASSTSRAATLARRTMGTLRTGRTLETTGFPEPACAASALLTAP